MIEVILMKISLLYKNIIELILLEKIFKNEYQNKINF